MSEHEAESVQHELQFYRRLLEHMHDWVWQVDEQAVIRYSTPRVRHILGYEPEEMIGKTPFDFMPADTVKNSREDFQKYASQKWPVTLHRDTFLHKEGRRVIVEESGSPIVDEKGNFRGFIVNSCDITEGEELRRKSEEKYRAIFENISIPLFLHDSAGTICDVNHATAEKWGLSREEIRGSSNFNVGSAGTHPYSSEEAVQFIRIAAAGQPQQFEWLARHRDDTLFWLKISLDPVKIGGEQYVIASMHEITEYKRAVESARENELRFRTLAETSASGIIIFQESEVVFANPAAERMLGYNALELKNNFWRQIKPDYLGLVMEKVRLCQEDIPTSEQITFTITAKNGEERWMLATHGRVIWLKQPAAAITFSDITEQRTAEEALRISEENYRSIFDGVGETIIIHDPETAEILEVNQATADLFGYSKEQMLKITVGDYSAGTPPYTKEDAIRWVRRAAAEGPQTFEWLVKKKDGELIWVEVHLKQAMMGGKYRVLCITHDIDTRKRAEEALRREQAYLTSAIEVLPLPIVFSDLHNIVERANEASYRFFRENDPKLVEPENWLRKRFADPVTHAIIPEELTPIRLALLGESNSGEYFIVFPNGKEVPILFNCAPVKIDDNIAAIVWTMQDITPLKEADRAKTQFLAVLSHELMTPLTSIQGYAQAALTDPSIIPEALQSIVRNTKRQHIILKNLLDVSRLLYGKLVIRPEAGELWQLASEAVGRMRPEADKKGVSILENPPPEPMPAFVDAARVEYAIENLLSNAIKFTDSGGRISVSGSRENGQAVLRIQDSGRGMSPDQINSLFIPFRQFKRTEKTGGLGLGLTLARGIVEQHGGNLTAASAGEGRGSTFTIAMPIKEALSEAA